MSQIFKCSPLYPSISVQLSNIVPTQCPNVQAIQLPRSTICHELREILATKVVKSLINKLNSIVLYSSEEQVCLASSVSKCVHQSRFYQLSILISVHVSNTLEYDQLLDAQLSKLSYVFPSFKCVQPFAYWILQCLGSILSSQFSNVSNRPTLYLSISVQQSKSVPTQCPNFSRFPIDQVYSLSSNSSNWYR